MRVPQLLSREQRRRNPTQAVHESNAGMHRNQATHMPFTPTSVLVVAIAAPDDPDSPP